MIFNTSGFEFYSPVQSRQIGVNLQFVVYGRKWPIPFRSLTAHGGQNGQSHGKEDPCYAQI